MAGADVDVAGDRKCVNLDALAPQLERALARYQPEGADDVTIRVRTTRLAPAGARVSLVVVLPDKSLGLERAYQLLAQDCSSANDLLVAVVSDFLEELPAKIWSAPSSNEAENEAENNAENNAENDAEALVATRRTLSLAMVTTGLLALDVSNGDALALLQGEVGAEASLAGLTQALSLGALVRGSTKRELGAGYFRPTALLAGIGISRGQSFRYGLRLRGGTVRVAGSGFDVNFAQWLPWAEVGAHLSYRSGWWEARLTVLASPLRNDIAVENRDDSVSLPRFRLGIGVAYALGSKKL